MPVTRAFDPYGNQYRVGYWVTFDGMGAARRHLATVSAAVRQVLATRFEVSSDLPYAYGINYGHHRMGSLARRAGGTRALNAAIGATYPRISPAIVRALPEGPTAVWMAMKKLERQTAEEAYSREAWLTGRLARSYLESIADRGGDVIMDDDLDEEVW